MPAIRVREDLHEKIAEAAGREGRSAANYLDWIVRPIVDAALSNGALAAAAEEPVRPERAATGRGPAGRRTASQSPRASRKPKVPAKPRTRGRASQEWVGCEEHPDAGAVAVSAGRHMCGEPGCARGARMASA